MMNSRVVEKESNYLSCTRRETRILKKCISVSTLPNFARNAADYSTSIADNCGSARTKVARCVVVRINFGIYARISTETRIFRHEDSFGIATSVQRVEER